MGREQQRSALISSVSLFLFSSSFPSSFTPVPSSPPGPPAAALRPLTTVSQLSSALLFDAVYAVVTAVQELNRSQEIGVKPLSCGSAQIWQHGTSLMNYLRMVRGGWGPAGGGRVRDALSEVLIPQASFVTSQSQIKPPRAVTPFSAPWIPFVL